MKSKSKCRWEGSACWINFGFNFICFHFVFPSFFFIYKQSLFILFEIEKAQNGRHTSLSSRCVFDSRTLSTSIVSNLSFLSLLLRPFAHLHGSCLSPAFHPPPLIHLFSRNDLLTCFFFFSSLSRLARIPLQYQMK